MQPADLRSAKIGFVVFRVMTPAPDGLPVVGRSARTLGVRIPVDIAPDAQGLVHPGTGGMSVAPDLWSLPNHRRPRAMGRGSSGPSVDRVFATDQSTFAAADLHVRPDPEAPALHLFVEPRSCVSIAGYEANLESTRAQWVQAWP